MNKEIWTSFKEGKTVINCQTEEEAKEFMKLCEKDYLKWTGGIKATSITYFTVYFNLTSYKYDEGLGYADSPWYSKEGYTVKTYKELMEVSEMKTYTTGDVLNELVTNCKLKFQALNLSSKEPIQKFLTSTDHNRIECLSHSNTYTNEIFSDQLWVLVRKPITFMEAANSGKKIRYEFWDNFYSLTEVIKYLPSYNIKELINGNWYAENL